MILKTPPHSTATETLHLSYLDQRTVRVYTQTLLIFPFPDENQAEAAITALTDGLRETLKKFPFLAGTLSLSDAESGKLVLTYPNELPDLRASRLFYAKRIPFHKFEYTYEQLKEAGMPPGVFTAELFRPDDLLNYPGIPPSGEGPVDFSRSSAPVFRFQANFIPGGLVLSMYFHHTLMDCSGINNFWNHLAKEISRARQVALGESIEAPVADTPPDQSELRRKLDEWAPAASPNQPPNADAYVDGTYTYDKTLADDAPCAVKYLIIRADRVRSFRDRLKQQFPEDSPPSICNVLAALLWIHVTRARASRVGDCRCRTTSTVDDARSGLQDCEHKKTNIGIATDLRKRRNPQLSEEYMGNLALFSKGTLSIADITAEDRVTEKTIVSVIREIRRAISQVDNKWIQNHLAFFRSLEQIKDTECALGFRFGRDIYVTSWMNFAADLQWNIPGTDLDAHSLDGRADYIRRTYGPSDGGMMIMPRRRTLVNGKEAPYEIMVRLAKVDMDTLLEEEGGLSDWCERAI